jgi:alpha-1,2-mannosyltransferase
MNGAGILAGGADLHVYREGAHRILESIPLYTEPMLLGLLYTYTPFSTIVFVPMEKVPWAHVTNVWLTVNLGVLLACVLLCWKLLGYRLTSRLGVASALLATFCVFLEPIRTTLFYGQINLVLMLLVLWDISQTESRLRGFGVGLAAGIKLTPVYFVAMYLALRQWRSAATAIAVFGASVALAWLVLPDDSRQYWTATFFQSTRIADDTHPANQSVRGAIAHVIGQAAPVWLWIVIAGLTAALSLTITARLFRVGENLLAVTLSGLTAAAVSPFSWSHHWVWFVPLMVYIVHQAMTRPKWWVAAVSIWLAAGSWPYRWDETNVVVGLFLFPPWWAVTKLILLNIYVIAYFCVVVASLAVLARAENRELKTSRDESTLPPAR